MIALYLDEDVPEAVAFALRLRGYDVLTVKEAGRKGLTDPEQLAYAHASGRILLTHNTADFCQLHKASLSNGGEHSGIIVAKQRPIGILLKGLLHLLSRLTPETSKNQLIWLSDWLK